MYNDNYKWSNKEITCPEGYKTFYICNYSHIGWLSIGDAEKSEYWVGDGIK